MNIGNHLLQNPSGHRAAWLGGKGKHADNNQQLRHGLQVLQQLFETSCGQFDEDEMGITEWRQARDAFDRAVEAFAANATLQTIESLCAITRRNINIAIEISTARCYYDGRI